MAPLSTVIVVSYLPGDWLAASLRSVIDQAGEVVVVDNGSRGEGASQIARSLGARTVRLSRNRGFAGGFEAGRQTARGDLIAVLNDDATADPTWLAAAASALDDPGIGAVTPKVVLAGEFHEVVLDDDPWRAPGDPRVLGRQLRSVTLGGVEVLPSIVGAGIHSLEQGIVDGVDTAWRWTAGGVPFYVPVPEGAADDTLTVDGDEVRPGRLVRVLNHAGSYLRDHGVAGEFGLGAPDDGRFDQPAERFGFSGTAPVFRAETLARIGGFAPGFFAYNEDTDWCLRARLAGLRVVYDPVATVTHRLSATSGGTAERFVRDLAQRNSLLCLVRNAPWAVARRHVGAHLRSGPGDGVRREVVRRLPWAVATRIAMHRLWRQSPRSVWDRWADADLSWDVSPTGPAR
jgi:GT2 family glycosyltransferase